MARQAAARLESEGRGGERVTVIDSAGMGGHLGLQTLAAGALAAAAGKGADLQGVIERVRQARKEVNALGPDRYARIPPAKRPGGHCGGMDRIGARPQADLDDRIGAQGRRARAYATSAGSSG